MPEEADAPATKGDIQQLVRLIERVETSLLTEFHKWAQTYEVSSRGAM